MVACTTPESTASEIETGSAIIIEPTPLPVETLVETPPTPITEIPTVTPDLLSMPTTEPAEQDSTAQDEELLAAQIDALIEGEQGIFSVVVVGPDGVTVYRHEPDLQIESASLYKLAIMVEIFRQRDAGVFSFDDLVYLEPEFFTEGSSDTFLPDEYYSIAELLEQMITVSSNVAAYALLALAGTANVNETMQWLGLTDTEIRWSPFEAPDLTDDQRLNVTSAGDLVLLFRLLLAGEVVTPEASEEMLELLKRQLVNDRLPLLLPADVEVAHKTGNLDGLDHDAGIIYSASGPMIVTVLTEGAMEETATDIIAQIGYLAYWFGSE